MSVFKCVIKDLGRLPFDWKLISVIVGRIQLFLSVKYFLKKVIPFEVFPFSRFSRNSRKYPLTGARLLTVVPPRKNANWIPKRLSIQCVSLLVGSFGKRYRTQLQPCR